MRRLPLLQSHRLPAGEQRQRRGAHPRAGWDGGGSSASNLVFFSLKQPRVCTRRRHVGATRPISQRNVVPRCSPQTFPPILHTQLGKPNDPQPLPIPPPFPPSAAKRAPSPLLCGRKELLFFCCCCFLRSLFDYLIEVLLSV